MNEQGGFQNFNSLAYDIFAWINYFLSLFNFKTTNFY